MAVLDIIPEDVMLGRDAPIGVPLLAQQGRKTMWKDMNCDFSGAVVTRAQSCRTPLKLPMTVTNEKGQDES